MVTVLPPQLTEEELAFRRALLADPELLDFLLEVDRPVVAKRQSRILPDLANSLPADAVAGHGPQ